MKNRILIGLILLSLIAGLIVVFGRHRLEQTSRNIEIVLDYPAFEQLQQVTKIPPEDLLKELKEAGISSVAIFEKTLNDLVKYNDLVIIGGSELAREYYLDGKLDSIFQGLFQPETDLDNYFLLFTRYDTYHRVANILQDLPDLIVRGSNRDNIRGIYVLEVENGDTHITNYLLGFSPEEVRLVKNAGLRIVPRVSDNEERLAIFPGILKDVINMGGEFSQVIFSGGTVIGYPDRLAETANILKDFDTSIGMIEPFIGAQMGIRELVVLSDMNVTRVHSLLQGEMNKYSYEKVLDRYVRAVKERNIRTLYYRPFLLEKDKVKPLELNRLLLQDLRTKLTNNGYTFGMAEPFPNERTSPVWIVVVSIGVLAAGLLLLEKFIILPDLIRYGLLGLGILATFVLTFKGYVLLSRDLLALVAAIVFPSLAVIYGYDKAQEMVLNNKGLVGQAILLFPGVIGITMIGVVMIIGLLSDVRYIYQINQFRGIKFSFVVPLLVLTCYYFKKRIGARKIHDYVKFLKVLPKFLNKPVRYSHLVLLGVVGIAGLIYIGRTGNFPILPVSSLEVRIRDLLEEILIYRPRFKEFAIGHPFMILGLYYILKKEKNGLTLPLLLIGSIGQLTIINTFSHIHTPVMVSLLRVISAIVLGIPGGILLIWLYHLVIRFLEKVRGWMYD